MVKEVTIMVSDNQLKELGNAIAAYADILWQLELGLGVPSKYECLSCEGKSDLKNRLAILKQLYNDLSK